MNSCSKQTVLAQLLEGSALGFIFVHPKDKIVIQMILLVESQLPKATLSPLLKTSNRSLIHISRPEVMDFNIHLLGSFPPSSSTQPTQVVLEDDKCAGHK